MKFSEREYQCLGQWEEDSQLLAYVQRKDMANRFECFVGATDDQGEVYLTESGFNCERNLRGNLVQTYVFPNVSRRNNDSVEVD